MTAVEPLSAERIFQTALAVIDGDGVKALTMRRVAGDLGVEAMSLYHHVPNKDGLVAGVLDLLISHAQLPTGEVSVGEWIEGTATGFRRLARQHPRAFPLLLTRPIPLENPATAEPLERGLAAFVAVGKSPEQALASVQAVSLALLSLGLLESAATLDEPTPPSRVQQLPSDTLPLLHALADTQLDLGLCWDALRTALVRGMTGADETGSVSSLTT